MLTFIICLMAVSIVSSTSPMASVEFSMANNKQSKACTLNYNNNHHRGMPSLLLQTTGKFQKMSNLVAMFQCLPQPIIRKGLQLYKHGKFAELINLLMAAKKLVKRYQLQKCKANFSFHPCSNSPRSAQPFFLWAKISSSSSSSKQIVKR